VRTKRRLVKNSLLGFLAWARFSSFPLTNCNSWWVAIFTYVPFQLNYRWTHIGLAGNRGSQFFGGVSTNIGVYGGLFKHVKTTSTSFSHGFRLAICAFRFGGSINTLHTSGFSTIGHLLCAELQIVKAFLNKISITSLSKQ